MVCLSQTLYRRAAMLWENEEKDFSPACSVYKYANKNAEIVFVIGIFPVMHTEIAACFALFDQISFMPTLCLPDFIFISV